MLLKDFVLFILLQSLQSVKFFLTAGGLFPDEPNQRIGEFFINLTVRVRNRPVHFALFAFGFFDSRKEKIPQNKARRTAHFFPTETARHIKKIRSRAFLFFEEDG